MILIPFDVKDEELIIDKAQKETNQLLSYNSLEDFLFANDCCKKLCVLYPPVLKILSKYYVNKQILQGTILYETVLLYKIASLYQMQLSSATEDKVRLFYSSAAGSLKQKGSPDECDGSLSLNGNVFDIEIKQPIARANSYDLKVNGQGFLQPNNNLPDIINHWISTINILDYLGHNIPMSEDFAKMMGNEYFNRTNWVVTTDNNTNNIVIFETKEELQSALCYKNSEIRITGKNWCKTKTLAAYFVSWIVEHGGKVDDNILYIPEAVFMPRTKQRGGDRLSDWRKINYIFRLHDKDILARKGSYVLCNINKIEQVNQNISAKICFVFD